jgi:hypothetical protein
MLTAHVSSTQDCNTSDLLEQRLLIQVLSRGQLCQAITVNLDHLPSSGCAASLSADNWLMRGLASTHDNHHLSRGVFEAKPKSLAF